jgi:serine/threonine protein kinase
MEEDAISGSAPHPAIDNIAPEGPVEVAPATGQGLADAARYSFDKIIGKGSSATVWKAFDKKEGTTVAVKEFECWDGSRSQFHREVEILKTLNAADEQGQYTVRLLDEFRNSNGRPCIVMNVSWDSRRQNVRAER